MPKRVLIQLDGDPQPSTFDAVVAVDAGAEVLLQHGGITPENVTPLVHGAMFTRGGSDLASTAMFVGGSDVAAAEAVAARVAETFFGPVRVGVLVDPSGANTTAAAAVVSIGRHVDLSPAVSAMVLGGTGPVGQRVARLLAGKGVRVTVASRSLERAEAVCERVLRQTIGASLAAVASAGGSEPAGLFAGALASADVIVAAGAAGVTLLDSAGRTAAVRTRVLVDLNAVPPAGIAGVAAADKARIEGSTLCYGALGVGGLKMKIHHAAIERIFTDPQAFLDAEELLAIGESLT